MQFYWSYQYNLIRQVQRASDENFCQDASCHDGKIPMKEVKVPVVSIP